MENISQSLLILGVVHIFYRMSIYFTKACSCNTQILRCVCLDEYNLRIENISQVREVESAPHGGSLLRILHFPDLAHMLVT